MFGRPGDLRVEMLSYLHRGLSNKGYNLVVRRSFATMLQRSWSRNHIQLCQSRLKPSPYWLAKARNYSHPGIMAVASKEVQSS